MEHSINEDRYNTIGMVNDILFVVYTERKENKLSAYGRRHRSRQRQIRIPESIGSNLAAYAHAGSKKSSWHGYFCIKIMLFGLLD